MNTMLSSGYSSEGGAVKQTAARHSDLSVGLRLLLSMVHFLQEAQGCHNKDFTRNICTALIHTLIPPALITKKCNSRQETVLISNLHLHTKTHILTPTCSTFTAYSKNKDNTCEVGTNQQTVHLYMV